MSCYANITLTPKPLLPSTFSKFKVRKFITNRCEVIENKKITKSLSFVPFTTGEMGGGVLILSGSFCKAYKLI